jgi:hypothetical protein
MTTFSCGDWKGEEEKSGGFTADRKISVFSSALWGMLHFGVIRCNGKGRGRSYSSILLYVEGIFTKLLETVGQDNFLTDKFLDILGTSDHRFVSYSCTSALFL